MPGRDDAPKTGDVKYTVSVGVDSGALANLQEAVQALAVQYEDLYERVENNIACLQLPLSRDDVDTLTDSVNQLLGKVDDDLTTGNFFGPCSRLGFIGLGTCRFGRVEPSC